MEKNKIEIQTGNIIVDKKAEKSFENNLSDIFESKRLDYDSEGHKPGSSKKKGQKRDRSWEKVNNNIKSESSSIESAIKGAFTGKRSSEEWRKALGNVFSSDPQKNGTIHPSRSGNETIAGGRAMLPSKNRNSIFEPESVENPKLDPFSESVVKDARKKKREREENKERSRDWEKPSLSQNSKNLKPAQMGYMPNRSAYIQPEAPKVKVPEIEMLKKQTEKNKQEAEKAVKIKEALNRVYSKELDFMKNDRRSWERQQLDEINKVQNKKYKVENSGIEITKDFVPTNESVKKENIADALKSIFSEKNETKELDIKKKSHIKERRKRREDDRSWEKASKPKKK